MGKTISIGLMVALVVGWFSLFFSNRAVLIGATVPEKGVGMLECRYFTGTGVTTRKFLYAKKLGLGLGRDTCPRLVMAAQ